MIISSTNRVEANSERKIGPTEIRPRSFVQALRSSPRYKLFSPSRDPSQKIVEPGTDTINLIAPSDERSNTVSSITLSTSMATSTIFLVNALTEPKAILSLGNELIMDRGSISNLIGAISLAFWLCNGIPLVYEIYSKKPDDA